MEADFGYRPGAVSVVITDPVDWSLEAGTALLVTVFGALFGAIVGVLWHAVAPQIGVVAAVEGSSAATKALIGDDLWLGLLGIVAGVVAVLLVTLVAPNATGGPGAQVGLAVGGVLGMLVAARVGHLIGHQDLAGVVATRFPQGGQRVVDLVLGYFDFKVRASAVLLTWPMASIFLSTSIAWVRALKNQPTVRPASPYPGFP